MDAPDIAGPVVERPPCGEQTVTGRAPGAVLLASSRRSRLARRLAARGVLLLAFAELLAVALGSMEIVVT
jgi:hypothetical protein